MTTYVFIASFNIICVAVDIFYINYWEVGIMVAKDIQAK